MDRNYEQEYKKAFEAAKGLHDAGNALTKKQMEIVFPELAESEDERIRKWIHKYIAVRLDDAGEFIGEYREALAWLEKQKEQKPVQSEVEREYVRTLKSLISDFIRGKEEVDREYYQQIFDWLDGRHIEQKPAEWSEEDEKMLEGTLMWLDDLEKQGEYVEKERLWLKSIRPVSKESLQSWKPSEEQMKWLKDVIETVPMTCRQQVPLESLYNDLKKL